MRFWTRPPAPGSLEEAIAVAVESYDEFRQFEYVSAVIVANHQSTALGEKALEPIQKLISELHGKFFGGKKRKVDEKEVKQFTDLMEGHVLRINTSKLAQAGAPKDEQPLHKPVVFNPAPRGRLLE